MIPAFLALMLAAASQADDEFPPQREVTFARGSHLGWSMEGRTVVGEGSPGRAGFPRTEPTISQMYCSARRNGIRVDVERESGLTLVIEARIVEEGRERMLREGHLRALLLDGTMWEVRMRSEGDFPTQFTDAAYAGPDLGTVNAHRNLAVRRPPGPVWLPIHTLADDLLRSRLLRLGFRPGGNDETEREEDPLIWVDVPLDGLTEALVWCQRAMASPAALRLHPEGVDQGPAPRRE